MSEDTISPGRRLMARLDEFAAFTDEPGNLTRLYLSPAHRRAAEYYIAGCERIGVAANLDASGNVRARYEGKRAGAPALMIGSHIDTVRDAGKYDGNLGALAALGVVEELARHGERLDVAVEIVAFGDEEGVRFPTTMTGSRALAGLFAPAALEQKDADGVTMREALKTFGCDPDAVATLRARNVAAFVELHIEQGPVLEAESLALGVVTAINGATRFSASVRGLAGHSGAVPMHLRQDALTASAEMILMIEARARIEDDLVATVGRIAIEPGAVNVIPGEARFSIDIRAPSDARRERAAADIAKRLNLIARERNVALTLTQTHEAGAYVCDPQVVAGLSSALTRIGQPPRLLPSGAGHDTMIMGALCPAGMLFVRCKGGVSHNPLESITPEDCELGFAALMEFVRAFKA